MKKIVIITYCTSSNSGTFLQAYAVGLIYKKMFPQCKLQYIKAKRIGQGRRKTITGRISFLQLLITKSISYIRNRYYLYLSKKYFPSFPSMPSCFEYDEDILRSIYDNNDIVSVGSDTILERFSYNGKVGLMWGAIPSKSKKVIFAGSGDNCRLLYSENREVEIKQRIESFDFVGVRDGMLYDFFVRKVGISQSKIVRQPDPTYFLSLSTFRLRESLRRELLKYNNLALFHFDRNFEFRSQLSALLKNMGYKLITPEYDPCCDISLGVISPFEWGDLFRYCKVVFTERFHDTVFALRHCVPVINIDWNKSNVSGEGKSKRTEILKNYGLDSYHLSIYKSSDITEGLMESIKFLIAKFDRKHISMVNELQIDILYKSVEKLKNVLE